VGRSLERRSILNLNDHPLSHSQGEDAWTDHGSFVLITEGKAPPRIELARERLLICGPLPGPDANHYRRLRGAQCQLGLPNHWHLRLPANCHVLAVRASQIAHALKLPRVSVVRRLEELIKHGYVERVGNAYRVTDKVNIPDLQKKLQRRIDMVAETVKRLAEVGGPGARVRVPYRHHEARNDSRDSTGSFRPSRLPPSGQALETKSRGLPESLEASVGRKPVAYDGAVGKTATAGRSCHARTCGHMDTTLV
jgi:hypothetical protein